MKNEIVLKELSTAELKEKLDTERALYQKMQMSHAIVKGLLQASRNVKDAMLFNILSYMSNELLTNGHTAASIDE